jgi:2-keto-3-deoxy-L-rhamnonate aldolase RhmA
MEAVEFVFTQHFPGRYLLCEAMFPSKENLMRARHLVSFTLICIAFCWITLGQARIPQQRTPVRLYNTAKQKLKDGKQIVGATVFSPDPNMYCAMANAGYDFMWIEMQHSPLTFGDVAKMIWACRGATAMPFIRVPDATESDIQKATDIGAVGIIVPTVDTVEEAQAAVKWAKYPPEGRRSQGNGQYGALWGSDYRQTANDNMVVVIMIETPIGVENAERIASVPGIDVIFAASTDLGNFSGYRQGDKEYEALVTRIHDVTLEHRIRLGGPQAWKDRPDRSGFTFFQAPGETTLIQLGAQVNLSRNPAPASSAKPGVAPTEGAEPR